MTESEVDMIIARFASAARICRAAGFTGVQVHAAHGYLLSSFLSPNANAIRDPVSPFLIASLLSPVPVGYSSPIVSSFVFSRLICFSSAWLCACIWRRRDSAALR